MASNPKMHSLPEDEQRSIMVTRLLDLHCPFPSVSSTELHEFIAKERWEIANRAGWHTMDMAQLRVIAEPYL